MKYVFLSTKNQNDRVAMGNLINAAHFSSAHSTFAKQSTKYFLNNNKKKKRMKKKTFSFFNEKKIHFCGARREFCFY